MSVTTDWAKMLSSVTWVSSFMMPSEPAMVRPPITTGRQAAMTPPKMKNNMTATSGSAMISARLMSSSIPADIAPATGCSPAISMVVPGRSYFSGRSSKKDSIFL